MRTARWKLHLPHPYRHVGEEGKGGNPGRYVTRKIELSLFDLQEDVGETRNVLPLHPGIVERLQLFTETARGDLGDALTKTKGENLRQPGKVNR